MSASPFDAGPQGDPAPKPRADWRLITIWIVSAVLLAAAIFFALALLVAAPEQERAPEPEDTAATPPAMHSAHEKSPRLTSVGFG